MTLTNRLGKITLRNVVIGVMAMALALVAGTQFNTAKAHASTNAISEGFWGTYHDVEPVRCSYTDFGLYGNSKGISISAPVVSPSVTNMPQWIRYQALVFDTSGHPVPGGIGGWRWTLLNPGQSSSYWWDGQAWTNGGTTFSFSPIGSQSVVFVDIQWINPVTNTVMGERIDQLTSYLQFAPTVSAVMTLSPTC
jgi:hypothetical protein